MADWSQVRWTEARQVVALQTDDPEALPDGGLTPRGHFEALREEDRREEAVAFLGVALPRFEAIAWASHVVEAEAAQVRLNGRDRQALDYALRWLGDPDDLRRRAAYEASEQAGARTPERYLGMAIFYSGGSVSLPDLPPVLPPPEVAGKCAAGAIISAAHRGRDAAAALDRALDLGDKVAQHGTRALSAS